ncbi:hypothetical protein A3A39_03565 [Candidatus Kaiserbacteria bacterium RIFCSPLOWO2_01_FULL_54_13]|uniref:Transcriptional repressor PaaX-like central Cas2-like domain-containing protein n=1 Tax=Candidatus Kaiserbacteria bacterium RIFCSPLOWO2_01_FULL_54_13 TaxID=1798512 RepID=A0A1F6EZY7_9BACT|nr:MAG: hypothetical protein A3A39_03565 [Candidatus Kaiserbacteria bacterium RIFCSPLOWO2_01_FULL_54_13]
MLISERRGDVLEKVLSNIGNFALAITRHGGNTSLSAYRAMREFERLQELSDSQLRYISRYIVDKKYITITKRGRLSEMTLTDAGRTFVQSAALRALKLRKQKRWDGKWRIVLFDIPNYMKAARDAFAATLKRLEFVHVQKSVFISPYPCEEEIEVVSDYFGVSENVEIIVAERLSHEEQYLLHFGLDSN